MNFLRFLYHTLITYRGEREKIRSQYKDYLFKTKSLRSEYEAACSRIALLTIFIRRGIKVEESHTCIEMEFFLYDAFVQNYKTFVNSTVERYEDAQDNIQEGERLLAKLSVKVAPYLVEQNLLTNTEK